MRALFLNGPGQLEVVERDLGLPGPGELLLRVEAATTCGTDLKAWRRGHPQIPMPGPFGHEWAGIVVAAGEGAKFKAGDAVMGVHSAPCGHCLWCTRGQENLCESIMATKVLGSYAQMLKVPQRIADVNVYPKPRELPFAEAAMIEPLACAVQGVLELKKGGAWFGEGSRALVIGPGAIGLMFVALLRREGVNVDLAGRNKERLAVGERLGAHVLSLDDARTDYDIVIEATGQVEIWERSVDFSRRGGYVMLFGGPPGGTRASFDTHRLHYDQITLLSPFHFGTAAVRGAAEALPGLGLHELLSGDRTLDEMDATFKDLDEGKGVKYVIRPNPDPSP